VVAAMDTAPVAGGAPRRGCGAPGCKSAAAVAAKTNPTRAFRNDGGEAAKEKLLAGKGLLPAPPLRHNRPFWKSPRIDEVFRIRGGD